jgi:hypothetical protein
MERMVLCLNSESLRPPLAAANRLLGRLSGQPNRRDGADHYSTRARVMVAVRRSSRLPGMPDAFDHAPLR